MWWKSWKFSWLKTRIGAHGLLHLALLLDVINRNQRNSSMLDCNLLIWGFICRVLVGDFVCLIFVWHFFISTDNVRQSLSCDSRLFHRSPLTKINLHGLLFHRWHCAVDQTSSVWHQCFTHAVVRQLHIRLETGGHGFHYIADGCFVPFELWCTEHLLIYSNALVCHTSADLGRFMMLR